MSENSTKDTDQVIHIPVKWIAIAIITILVAAIACKWVWTDRQMINDANTLADCDTKMKIYKEEMKKYNELKEEYNNLKTKSELKNQQLSTVEGQARKCEEEKEELTRDSKKRDNDFTEFRVKCMANETLLGVKTENERKDLERINEYEDRLHAKSEMIGSVKQERGDLKVERDDLKVERDDLKVKLEKSQKNEELNNESFNKKIKELENKLGETKKKKG